MGEGVTHVEPAGLVPETVSGTLVLVRKKKDILKASSVPDLVMASAHMGFLNLPLFQKSKAVIQIGGGITSHMLVISREFGVPAYRANCKEEDLIPFDGKKVVISGGRIRLA